MGKATQPKMETVNNTPLTEAQIAALKPIMTVRNNWRNRTVTLYEHPTDPARVISIGLCDPFRNGQPVKGGAPEHRIIADESREEWADSLINGRKVYN